MLKKLGKAKYAAMQKRAQGTYPLTQAIIDCMKLVAV